MRLRDGGPAEGIRARTYRSFAFEWTRFSSQLSIYRENFRWYTEPLGEESVAGRLVLDAGCGMGRHTHHFLARGARVIAVDASPAIDTAHANNPSDDAVFVQADILHLPLPSDACDVASCLGVLHHLEDPLRALRELVRVVRPGGWVLIYVYHDLSAESRLRRWLLAVVAGARKVTTRTPYPLLRLLTFALAAVLYAGYVCPCRLLAKVPGLRSTLVRLPLGQYFEYPFRVLWNDQFDRFSAPLERRYTRQALVDLLENAGLIDLHLLGGYGWRAAGRKPAVAR
jgi:SAM-dependent methyltransferase